MEGRRRGVAASGIHAENEEDAEHNRHEQSAMLVRRPPITHDTATFAS